VDASAVPDLIVVLTIRTSPGYASEGAKENRQVTCMIQSNKMLSVLKLEEYIVVLRIFRMKDIVLQ
jgi:hypothetical protein